MKNLTNEALVQELVVASYTWNNSYKNYGRKDPETIEWKEHMKEVEAELLRRLNKKED